VGNCIKDTSLIRRCLLNREYCSVGSLLHSQFYDQPFFKGPSIGGKVYLVLDVYYGKINSFWIISVYLKNKISKKFLERVLNIANNYASAFPEETDIFPLALAYLKILFVHGLIQPQKYLTILVILEIIFKN